MSMQVCLPISHLILLVHVYRLKHGSLYLSHLAAKSRVLDSISQDVTNIQNLSALEVKEKLKELGLQTRVRKLEKLQEILKQALSKD